MTRPFTITVFGAESTGKTTLSRDLAHALPSEWVYEFARPYLETTHQDVTRESMHAIWMGQAALQRHATRSKYKYVVQDTDLFSTAGYWKLTHVELAIGPCPERLILDADTMRSDLYIIASSNIPFEPDVLRYGGDKRESIDAYWVGICEQYSLPYVVLNASDQRERVIESLRIIHERSLVCVA